MAKSVPDVIYTIPPDSPLYNVTYVRIYDSTPDTVVVGYTSGYNGEYVAATGVLMFGAGMIAGGAIADEDDFYTYYPYPAYYSYGCAARYDYAYGGYYRSASHYYGPYGGAGRAAWYNPVTGTYARSAYAYGPEGAAQVRQAYNPNTGNWGVHARATNGYQSWGRTSAEIGGTEIQAGHRAGPSGKGGWVETSAGKSALAVQGPEGRTVVKTGGGDVYAGNDGNVYRRTDTGQWQSHTDGGWQSRPESPASHNQLNQQYANRNYGDERARESASYRSSDGGYGRSGGVSAPPRGGARVGGPRGGRR